MPCLVTFGFLLYAACKRFGDIDSGLVCDAEKYPKDICYFFFDIIFFSLLKGLVAILARHNSCQFTYFFGQYGHIGELAEVTHSILLNPGVYFFLCFFQLSNVIASQAVHHKYGGVIPELRTRRFLFPCLTLNSILCRIVHIAG